MSMTCILQHAVVCWVTTKAVLSLGAAAGLPLFDAPLEARALSISGADCGAVLM
jgi:hypothetical protein